MQYVALLHEHSLATAGVRICGAAGLLEPPRYAWQDFLLALIDPSLHMNVSPWHCETPPLRPLHGVFAA